MSLELQRCGGFNLRLDGKRGYLQCAQAAGVVMILAGCYASGCGDDDRIEDYPGEWWFCRDLT